MNKVQNVSFKSNIHFVDIKTFDKIKKGKNIDHLSDTLHIRKADDFFTTGVMTCSAGGFVIPFKEAVGFHFHNTLQNSKKTRQLALEVLNDLSTKASNGLLLGSKYLSDDGRHPNRIYSLPLFKGLKETFAEKIENISIFQEHRKAASRTHLYYSKDEDAWYICAESRRQNKDGYYFKSVDNINALVAFYKNISIAKTDTLFINGKEILRRKKPSLYAK